MSVIIMEAVLGTLSVFRKCPGLGRIVAGTGHLTVPEIVGSIDDRRNVFLWAFLDDMLLLQYVGLATASSLLMSGILISTTFT